MPLVSRLSSLSKSNFYCTIIECGIHIPFVILKTPLIWFVYDFTLGKLLTKLSDIVNRNIKYAAARSPSTTAKLTHEINALKSPEGVSQLRLRHSIGSVHDDIRDVGGLDKAERNLVLLNKLPIRMAQERSRFLQERLVTKRTELLAGLTTGAHLLAGTVDALFHDT
jgi:hypothetical protein